MLRVVSARAMIEQNSRERTWTSGFPEVRLQADSAAADFDNPRSNGLLN
jgi:hypothetical protein